MHIDPYIVLGSAVVGLLVGMTGAGGGALMTPMLILLFGVTPSSAISSDLVAAVRDAPGRRRRPLARPAPSTGAWSAGWCSGSVPGGVPRRLPAAPDGQRQARAADIEIALGAALLVGAAAMVLRFVLDRRSRPRRARRACTSVVAAAAADDRDRRASAGIIVGMTSVGSGSLMIVLLLFLYPAIGANQLVGTDLTQAVPLTLAAALGALAFGHVEFGVTASLVIGSVPAVLVGSLLSSSVPDRYVRPAIAFVILASGLKYVGLGTTALGWTLCARAARRRDRLARALARLAALRAAARRRRRRRRPQPLTERGLCTCSA